MGVRVPETMLHEAWRRADGSRTQVSTKGGENYRVLYSGMPGGSYGPDFRDAVLERGDGSEVVGDVEIHRDLSDWYAHGHDSDPKYGSVAFHAVGERLSKLVDKSYALNHLGFEVPEIGIESLIDDVGDPVLTRGGAAQKTIADGMTEGSVGDWLDAMGDERFALKISSMRIDVERFGPDLALQMAIFECLGYPRNRVAFRQLAKRLPWAFMAGFAGRNSGVNSESGDACRQVARATALLFWGAGLGRRPSWSPVQRLVGDDPVWTIAAGRPSNRPEARIAAAAHLVVEWWRSGGPFRHAAIALGKADRSASLRNAYRVRGGFLGSGRAGEIVVNAVLPLLAAWADAGRDGALYSKSMRVYGEHPSLPSNSVYEEAKRVLGRRGFRVGRLLGARQQQGAIHIYKSMLMRPRASRQMRLGRPGLSS